MSIPVTRTRIIIPRRRPDLISRERLLVMLDDLLEYRLFLISAPAGYGKTSLLIDHAHQVEYPVCWYSLDALDDDFQRFLAHLIAAVQQQFPQFGERSLSVLENTSQSQTDRDRLLRTIVNDAFEHIDEHFTMVVDDYHLVEDNQEINHFINDLVQEMDENFHLIISSRTLLSLPDLPLMVGRSQVKGLSFEELAFRPDEIQTLMQAKYHQTISDRQAKQIAERTEGWITGLLLSAETMWKGLAGETRIPQVSGVDLYDYLAQQVLDQQSPTMRTFLLRSSLMEEFNAPLCEQVLGDPPRGETWVSMINKVMQYNLFVQPFESEGMWLRYNHLFRDFLQERLTIERPEEKERLLRKMVEVYTGREEWEKAYLVCQQLGDDHTTAELIETAGIPLQEKGQFRTLAKWIDRLPEPVLESHPAIQSRRGALALVLGDTKVGLSYLEKTEKPLKTVGELKNLVQNYIWQASAHRLLGNYSKGLDYAEQALKLANNNALDVMKAESHKVLGLIFHQLSDSQKAYDHLTRSKELYRMLDLKDNVAQVSMDLGTIYLHKGKYHDSETQYLDALHRWEELENITQKANLYNNMGVLATLNGNYERALEYFNQSLDCARDSGYRRMEGFAYTSLGDLYAELEAFTVVKENYMEAEKIAKEVSDQYLINYLEITQASLARRLNKHVHAHHILDDVEQSIQNSGSKYENGLFHFERGKLFVKEGKPSKAVPELDVAVQEFERGEQRVEISQAHLYLAQAYLDDNNEESAIHHTHKAFQVAKIFETMAPLISAGREVKQVLRAAQNYSQVAEQASRLLSAVRDFEKELPSLQHAIYEEKEDLELFVPGLTIQTLGRARVKQHGQAVDAPEFTNQRSVRELFYFLLSHPDGLRKKSIGQALWPDSTPEDLKRKFKNAIYRLRRALGKEVVIYDQEERRYRFNWGWDYRYDVEDFRTQLSRARNAESLPEKISALESAVSIYRHPYLPRVSRVWVEPIRNRLFRQYKEAALTLSELYLDDGQYHKAIQSCQGLLVIDPCQERAHRLTMQAHAALGDRAAVARQYQACQEALSRDLDTHPSPETDQLYKDLME